MRFNDLYRVSPPTSELFELEALKAHLRIDFDEDDDYITALITAATSYVEGNYGIGVALLTQTWRGTADRFSAVIELPLGPVQAVNAVTYRGADGEFQTVDPSVYITDLDHQPARLALASGQFWPTPSGIVGGVKVTFECGYGDDPADVPADIRHAILLLVGDWYENRQATVGVDRSASPVELPFAVSAVLDKYRVTTFD